MDWRHNLFLVTVFLVAMTFIVMTGCATMSSDDPSWVYPKNYSEVFN